MAVAVTEESPKQAETAEQAWARGFAEGERQSRQQAAAAEAERQRAHDAAMKALGGELRSVATLRDALLSMQRDQASMLEASLARLTSLAAARLLSALAEEDQLASAIARSVLAQFPGIAAPTLRMSPADISALPAGLAGAVRIAPDDALPRGSWHVVTDHESIDCAIDRQLRLLDEALRHDANAGR